jgi:hypothetical protein
MLPATTQRVPAHTRLRSNQRIREQTETSLEYYATHPDRIGERLAELEREWDIERTLEVNGSVLAMSGLALGTTVNRKWLLLPFAVVGFCLQHALQGWCPPLAVFRRLGIRTQREIDEERFALKALRGDFRDVPEAADVGGDPEAVRQLLERVRRG